MNALNEKVLLDEKRPPSCDEVPVAHNAYHDVAARNHSIISKDGAIVNASGHRDQLQRQYGLLAICGLALTIDNAWVAFGGSLSVAVWSSFGSPLIKILILRMLMV